MIKITNNYFQLDTANTSYVFSYTNSGLLIHHYYGAKVPFKNYENIKQKLHGGMGTAVVYENLPNHFTDNLDLEFSMVGCGDFREPFLILNDEKLGYTNNFKYQSYKILKKTYPTPTPTSHDESDTLVVVLKDAVIDVTLELYYKVFESSDVISRYARIVNNGTHKLSLHRLMSLQLDIPSNDFVMMTFNGTWGKERHLHEKSLNQGVTVNDSKTGVSSNRNNPLFILRKSNTSENLGESYGFNLVYSGNHFGAVENTFTDKIHVVSGINPYCFEISLNSTEEFTSPEAIMTYSNQGLNRLSQNFHSFVNNHIIDPNWAFKPRPILVNNWEATYFNFNEKKILEIGKKAKDLGIELLVLDDGWFGKRDNDHSSLGDYNINAKKLPNGIKGLCDKVNKLGLQFGLWVEPEMVNEDSILYKNHPEYAVKVPLRVPSLGRNQMLLDLTNPEVRKYITKNLIEVLESANISYVKWDFNRPFSDMYGSTLSNQGEFFHKYMLGLYEILETVTKKFPNILFEGCASGGNRFDLGMLCYFPQIWTSDDTDYLERIYIQEGTSYGYPLSTISNHVSAIPNHQMLRNTPIESRFNLASFGVFGYELDLTELTSDDIKKIKTQVKLYKEHREVLQFGTFYRSDRKLSNGDSAMWYVVSSTKDKAIAGFYQNEVHPAMAEDIIYLDGLDENTLYYFRNIPQKSDLRKFGGLINIVLPVKIRIGGKVHNIICKLYQPSSEPEYYEIYGSTLKHAGIRLHQQFMGTGFNSKVRVLGDFGSRMYVITNTPPKRFYKLVKQNITIKGLDL